MSKIPVIQFFHWLSLFKGLMEAEYGMEVAHPMYHELVLYRKLYDSGCSPQVAVNRLMENDAFALCVPVF
jgi:hypothetical protein